MDAMRSDHPGITGLIAVHASGPGRRGPAFEEAHALVGRPDVVINNAGISRRHEFTEIPFSEWREVMGINLVRRVPGCLKQAARRRWAPVGPG